MNLSDWYYLFRNF